MNYFVVSCWTSSYMCFAYELPSKIVAVHRQAHANLMMSWLCTAVRTTIYVHVEHSVDVEHSVHVCT